MLKATIVYGTAEEFENCIQIRNAVFQDNAAFGADENDAYSVHVLVYECASNGDQTPCATGRMHPTDSGWLIGRVSVLQNHRNQGIGDMVVRMLLLRAIETYREASIYIHSLPSAVDFYKRYGFERIDDININGIQLVNMSIYGCDVRLDCRG